MALIIGVVIVLLILFGFLCYKKAPPTEAIVVTGFGLARPKVVCGKGTFVLPVLQRADRLNMRLLKIDVKTPETGVKTQNGVSLWIDSVVTIQVYSENSTVLDEEVKASGLKDAKAYIMSRQQAAISNFLGMNEQGINDKVNDVLQGNLREIVSDMTVDQILTNRKQMALSVIENARPDLAKMGLEVVTFNVQDIRDAIDGQGHNHGVIEAIGIEQEELVKKQAEIARAQAARDVACAKADAEMAANGRRHRRQRRAKANGTLSKKCVKQTTAQNGSVSKRAKEIGVIKRHLPGCEKDVLCIGIKNKEAKFTNRTRPEEWLTPTANQLLQTHINLVKKIQKFLPISDVVLEVNKFAFMQLDNPNIQKWQYQKGPLYKKENLESTVSEMQEHHCLFCKKPIDHYHHVVPQHKNGSNTIGNIVGLCAKHHDLVHKETAWQEKLTKKKTGLNKKYGALSVLNQIIPALTKELSVLFPKHFFVTTGKSTYDYRTAHGVSKDHWLDAYCIACSVLPNDVCDNSINSRVPYELKQFRRHDRRALNNENMNRVYTLNDKAVATNRHKATEQESASLEEFRKEQPDDVCRLKVKEHYPTYRNMNRNYPGSVFFVGKQIHVMQGIAGSKDGKATTYKDTNTNSITAGKCKFVAKNSGVLFV